MGVYGVKRVYQGRRGIRGKGGISSSRGYRGYAPASGVNGVNAHQKGIGGIRGIRGRICGKAAKAKAQKECQADSINWLVQVQGTRYQVVYQVNDERSQQQVMPQQNIGPQCCL